MKKENISKVIELNEEYETLRYALSQLQGGCELCVYNCSANKNYELKDQKIVNATIKAIKERLKDIDIEIEIL